MNEHALATPRAVSRERAGWKAAPWTVAAVVVVLYAATLLPRLASPNGVYAYVHIGREFLHQAHSSTVIPPSLPTRGRIGYDGQFYFFLTADPRHAKDYMDAPAYRYSRIGYPALARALSGGNAHAAPYALLFVNLAAIAAGTLAVAIWLKRRRVSPWFALLYGFFPGLVFGVVYDVAEPLAFALVAWAVLVFDRRSWRRVLLSAALFAYALLTRETVALIPLVLALSLLLEGGSWSTLVPTLRANLARAAAFAGIAFGPMFAWRLYVPHLLASLPAGGPGAGSATGGGLSADTSEGFLKDIVPLHGIVNLWPWNESEVLVFLTVVLPGIATTLLVLRALRRERSAYMWLVLLSAVVFVLCIPTWMLINFGGAGRAAIGVFVPLLLALPTLRDVLGARSRLLVGTLCLWTVPFFVVSTIAISLAAHHAPSTQSSSPAPAARSVVAR